MRQFTNTLVLAFAALAFAVLCFATPAFAAEVGEPLQRTGDEIMVCGQLFHTTTPVVLWVDPGGYDAYRTDRRFGPIEKASWEQTIKELPDMAANGPSRYGLRTDGLDALHGY